MPQLPENIIDRLTAMERRIRQLSTGVLSIAGSNVIADDATAGGLARPWLTMVPPQDMGMTRWPQTTSKTFTTIALSKNPIWQPKMRVIIVSGVSTGATGQVKVLVNGVAWGSPFTAGGTWDHTDVIATDFGSVFGQIAQIEIQAEVTSTSGTVYAMAHTMYGTQS